MNDEDDATHRYKVIVDGSGRTQSGRRGERSLMSWVDAGFEGPKIA